MLLFTAALATETLAVHPAGAIQIDGVLDEPAWDLAEAATEFRRFQPTDGGAPPGTTEVRFLQDAKYLYVGIRVRDTGYKLRARISPREAINADDQVGVYLDTFDDKLSGYIFYFNPLGVQQDIRHNAGRWNVSWDTVLKSKGKVTDDGFELEIAFPWRSLKFPRSQGEPQEWGVVLTRKVPHEGAKYSWPKLVRNTPRIFADANRLVGVKPPNRGSGLELLPSITAGQSWPREPQTIWDRVRPSLDMRLGLTPDLGITATLNPDFSQVESDVSDVRVNARFAFQFPERRPFFLAGIDWFEDRRRTLYTRTMNAPLYGLKVGGREGPLSVGVMHVLDRRPLPSFTEGGTPGFEEADVDGRLASNTLVRARLDAFNGGYAGITLADKRLLGSSSTHQLFGVDFEVPMGNRWIGGGSWQHSLTGKDGGQRWGTEQSVTLDRAKGVGTAAGVEFLHRTPDYRREIGFLNQADLTLVSTWIDHTFTPQGLVSTFAPGANLEVRQEGNGDAYYNLGIGHTTVFSGIHRLTTWTWGQRFLEQGATVDGYGAFLEYGANLGRVVDVSVSGVGGQVIDYESLQPALTTNLSATLTLRPLPFLRSDSTVRWNGIQPRQNTLAAASLIRNRLTLQVSRALGARWVLDYNKRTSNDPRIYNSLLVTWLKNPGTALWAGGSVVNVPGQGFTEGTVFAKLSILFRP